MNRPKKRHGCLRVWLVFMLISNLFAVSVYLFGNTSVRDYYPNSPTWVFLILILGGVLNIIFIFALFYWKKWGFWGLLVTYLVSFFINLYLGLGIIQALIGLSGLAIFYGVLQIGGEQKGWSQLE